MKKREFWARFKRNRLAISGLVLVTGMFAVALLAPWLAPYDLGISQDVRLLAIPTGEYNIYRIEVTIYRLSGDVASWQRVNRGFLNDIRKMFLVWKTSPPEAKAGFTRQGREMLEAIK